mmetsp:Transcript_44065/g.99116  ORF Transcript_44065/g.99116 Transcript_44065/m.99116 type:complete len:461 (-) Transcript_44065:106-1488(-)
MPHWHCGHKVARQCLLAALHATLALLLTGCSDNEIEHPVYITYTCLDFNGITGVCSRWHQRGQIVIFEDEEDNDDEEDGGGCFPADAVVFGRHGPMQISELGVGDEVLGYDAAEGTPVYTEVRTWLHWHPTADTPMLELHTQHGHSFVASPGHMVALDKADGANRKGSSFVRARELAPGHALITGSGRSEEVASVKEVQGKGLYAPLTYTSNLFVGGPGLLPSNVTHEDAHHGAVLVHSFAHVSEPQRYDWAWHLLLSAVERIKPSWTQASVMNRDDGYVHPVARLFMRLLGIAPIESIAIDREIDGISGRRLKGGGGGGGAGGRAGGGGNNEEEKKKELLLSVITGALGLPPFLSMAAVRPEPPVDDIHSEIGNIAPSVEGNDSSPNWTLIVVVIASVVLSLVALRVFMKKRAALAERSFSGILNVRGPADANYQGEVVVGEVVGVTNAAPNADTKAEQ